MGREREDTFSFEFCKFLGGGIGTGLFGGVSTGFGFMILRRLVTLMRVDKLFEVDKFRRRKITTPCTLLVSSSFFKWKCCFFVY